MCSSDLVSQDITAINHQDNLDTIYLLHFLKSKKLYFIKNSRGATIQGFNRKAITNLEIPLLPIDVQREFASKVSTLEHDRKQILESLDNSRALFSSLQSVLFNR